ncbi:hypothetical protein QQ73_08905, partial [Candidatus Endoriftia persephone str. Guaymas]|nr:hypothetical protein [Candidatus Endoriftia persephone str. Guaymas]
WQQAGLALALLFLLLLAVALRWLWRLLQHQLDLLHDREARDRQLDERLRELERSLLREQSQLGQHLAER